jgi:hypothetical protein
VDAAKVKPARLPPAQTAAAAGHRRLRPGPQRGSYVSVNIAAGEDRCTETQARTHGMLAPLDASTNPPVMVAHEN